VQLAPVDGAVKITDGCVGRMFGTPFKVTVAANAPYAVVTVAVAAGLVAVIPTTGGAEFELQPVRKTMAIKVKARMLA